MKKCKVWYQKHKETWELKENQINIYFLNCLKTKVYKKNNS